MVAYMLETTIAITGDPADALAAVAALRRLADQLEDLAVERAMRAAGLAAGGRGARRHPAGGSQEARPAADRRGRHAEAPLLNGTCTSTEEAAMVTRFAEYAPVGSSGTRKKEAEKWRARPSIEAEHLLLALAAARGHRRGAGARRSWPGPRRGSRAALDREMRHSLTVAGVELPPDGRCRGPAGDPSRRQPAWSASSKLVFERAVKAAAGQRQLRPGHLLLGVLGAQAGTVPRALALAGVNQAELAARTRQALTAPQ